MAFLAEYSSICYIKNEGTLNSPSIYERVASDNLALTPCSRTQRERVFVIDPESTTTAYERAGVDTKAGDRFSSFAGRLCRSTYQNSPFVKIIDWAEGKFRGSPGFQLINLPADFIQTAATDVMGTKVVPISVARNHLVAAKNLIAMAAGKITSFGGLPLIIMNTLDTATLGKPGSVTFELFKQMMFGLKLVADNQSYVLFDGKTAQLPDCVTSEVTDSLTKFNWGATMIGVMSESKFINGRTLRDRQCVMSLRDVTSSNGLSCIRKSLQTRFGREWWKEEMAMDSINEAAAPCALYDRFLTRLNGWHHRTFEVELPVHFIAHLNGGAFQSKFADVLCPLGFSAVLYDLWPPPKVMLEARHSEKMTEEEFFATFSAGQRALVVIEESDVRRFEAIATLYGLEAKCAGWVYKSKDPTVTITSHVDRKKKIVMRPV